SAARTPSSAAEIPGNLGAEPQRALGSAESSAGVGFQASAPVPAPAGLEAAASKPPRDSNANILLWSLAGLLFAIAVAMGIQVFGVYDIKSAVLGAPPEEAQASRS